MYQAGILWSIYGLSRIKLELFRKKPLHPQVGSCTLGILVVCYEKVLSSQTTVKRRAWVDLQQNRLCPIVFSYILLQLTFKKVFNLLQSDISYMTLTVESTVDTMTLLVFPRFARVV